jgi:hypothetical protein
MNESEWNSCTDPKQMLAWLRRNGKLSERKARLFAVACCRDLWPWIVDEFSNKVVEVAERYADGNATEAELRQAHNAFHAEAYMLREAQSWWGQRVLEFMNKAFPFDDEWPDLSPTLFDLAVLGAASRKAVKGANIVVRDVVRVPEESSENRDTTMAQQACGVLRDLFANPSRPVAIDSSLLRWNDGLLVKLAQGIYDEKEWDRVLVLADALEEAGGADEEVLFHLRQQGVSHSRGCWAIDLLLNRN